MYASNPEDFQSVRYWVDKRVAHIQLNRPARFNAIDAFMPFELEKSVELANLNDDVRVCEECIYNARLLYSVNLSVFTGVRASWSVHVLSCRYIVDNI